MWNWIKKLLARPPSGEPLPQDKGGGEMLQYSFETGKYTPVRETDSGKLWKIIARGECPDCHSKEGFYEGPSGGMSTNISCANPACCKRFNVTPAIGIAERI